MLPDVPPLLGEAPVWQSSRIGAATNSLEGLHGNSARHLRHFKATALLSSGKAKLQEVDSSSARNSGWNSNTDQMAMRPQQVFLAVFWLMRSFGKAARILAAPSSTPSQTLLPVLAAAATR